MSHSIESDFQGEAAGLTRGDVLDNVTIAWLTNTAIRVGFRSLRVAQQATV